MSHDFIRPMTLIATATFAALALVSTHAPTRAGGELQTTRVVFQLTDARVQWTGEAGGYFPEGKFPGIGVPLGILRVAELVSGSSSSVPTATLDSTVKTKIQDRFNAAAKGLGQPYALQGGTSTTGGPQWRPPMDGEPLFVAFPVMNDSSPTKFATSYTSALDGGVGTATYWLLFEIVKAQ